MGSSFFTGSCSFFSIVVLLLSCLMSSNAVLHEFSAHQEKGGEFGKKGYELELTAPEEELHFEGGSLRIWRKDVSAFPDKGVDVSEITFEEDGLMLPQYADADGISYVLQGTGKLGVISSFEGGLSRSSVRRVERGDIVAIPKGVVFWWYNDGYGQHKIFCASDTSKGVNPGFYHQFSLAGAKEERFGGLLHGFSTESLASAWDVDEQMVTRLLEGQNATTIVKSPRRIRLPDPRMRRMHLHVPNAAAVKAAQESYSGFSEFRYNIDKEYPDHYVKRGGWKKGVDESVLPVLGLVGMSAVRVGLERNAIEAPVFFPNANQILYIIRGSGKIEVSSNDGENLLNTEVQEGSVLVIPKFLPSIKVAGDEGLSFLAFLTSSRHLPSYLIGRNSFDEGIPKQVMAGALNVDEETVTHIRQGRKYDEAFLPPIFPPTTIYT